MEANLITRSGKRNYAPVIIGNLISTLRKALKCMGGMYGLLITIKSTFSMQRQFGGKHYIAYDIYVKEGSLGARAVLCLQGYFE